MPNAGKPVLDRDAPSSPLHDDWGVEPRFRSAGGAKRWYKRWVPKPAPGWEVVVVEREDGYLAGWAGKEASGG